MTMDESMKKGYLWTDTGGYMEEQARAKDLMYEFNHTKPSDEERRNQLVREIFGSVGENVCVMQPITLARGKTVHIGMRNIIIEICVWICKNKIMLPPVDQFFCLQSWRRAYKSLLSE